MRFPSRAKPSVTSPDAGDQQADAAPKPHRRRESVGPGGCRIGAESLPRRGDVASHRPQVLVAIVRSFLQRSIHDPDDVFIETRAQPLQRLGRAEEDLPNDSVTHSARERLLAGEQLVEDGPDRKDVAPVIHDLAAELLGRHVVDAAQDRIDLCEA